MTDPDPCPAPERPSAPAPTEDRYRRLIDNLPVAVYRTSAEGRILEVNQAGAQMFGFPSVQAMLDTPVAQTYAEPDARERHLAERRESGGMVQSILKLRRQDDSTFWARDTSRAVLDEDGALLYTDGTLEDVTSEVEAQRALRVSEETLRTFHDLSPTAILRIDADGRIATANPAAGRLVDRPLSDLVGGTFAAITHPDDKEASRLAFEALRDGHQDEITLEKRYLRPDGSVVWAEVRAVAARRDDGSLRHVVSLINDITDRRRRLEELELLARLSHAMEAAPDLDAAFQEVLEAVCGRLGCAYGEVWQMGDEGELVCLPPWNASRDGLEKFRRLSQRLTFPPGRGLAGRAYAEGKAVWTSDLFSDRSFVRATAAKAAGLQAGIAVPVMADGKPAAVLGFFADGPRGEDEAAIRLVSAVAEQLGAVVHRRDVEARLRRRLATMEAVAEEAEEAFLALDLEGDVLGIDRRFLAICGVLPDGDDRPAWKILPEVRRDEAFESAVERLYASTGRGREEVEWNKVLYRRRSASLRDRGGDVFGRAVFLKPVMELA